jgi:hypothetical protein
MVIEEIIKTGIYSWVTKKWSSKPGLLNTIGTIEVPRAGLSLDNAYRIWNTKAFVEGVQLYMDIGKIYVSFVSYAFSIHHHNLLMKFGVWIKVPDDKTIYLVKQSETKKQNKKRKNTAFSGSATRKIPNDKNPANKKYIKSTYKNKVESYDDERKNHQECTECNECREDESDEHQEHREHWEHQEHQEHREHRECNECNEYNECKEPEKDEYTGEINLLEPRTLLELLKITRADSYVQLGDLYFEERIEMGKHR